MFEAHTLEYQSQDLEAANSATIDLSALKEITAKQYHRRHDSSLRPLTIWFAEGKRKDRRGRIEPTLFTYIEYRDALGNQRFHCLEEAVKPETCESRLERLLSRAARQSLRGI
ncbi:hypothetical protein [Marinobacterium jannaschii]|uniref:hypothetical protein n=1 Tax=Marinobacterium jannaschii TaxID=64970 RepID=UPI000481C689|nr:hypothetical protein [Marinobacterium jannaschii]